VAVKQGRWWELGSTPYEGGRIKAWRPHWSVLHKSSAEDISLYGSEKEKWAYNPLIHPFKWLHDPYYLEKLHYEDRPYPVASPAFTNVPLVGPLLAATIGRIVKPPVLKVVSPEMQRALSAQWVMQEARIAPSEGQDPGEIGEGGRLYTKEGRQEYDQAETRLDYGNWLRSKEIADFFSRTGFALPDRDSAAYDGALDYQDVEFKIIQQEGYDAHDFNLFDDRASVLWRKPYVDGAVRELTSGDDRSAEEMRRSIEQLMVAAKDKNADVRATVHASPGNHANVRVHVDVDQTRSLHPA
jgi:hypothetical protein